MVGSILVSLETSNPKLSKSGKHDFSITLTATTDSEEAVTINPFQTMLHGQMAVFEYQGFTFRDEAGDYAKRNILNVCYAVEDGVAAAAAVEIPPVGSSQPFSITHIMQCSVPQTDEASELERLRGQLTDQTAGLEIGHSYEIGLGTDWSSVLWWRIGSKAEVFRGNARLLDRCVGEKLPLVLLSKTVIEVVE